MRTSIFGCPTLCFVRVGVFPHLTNPSASPLFTYRRVCRPFRDFCGCPRFRTMKPGSGRFFPSDSPSASLLLIHRQRLRVSSPNIRAPNHLPRTIKQLNDRPPVEIKSKKPSRTPIPIHQHKILRPNLLQRRRRRHLRRFISSLLNVVWAKRSEPLGANPSPGVVGAPKQSHCRVRNSQAAREKRYFS